MPRRFTSGWVLAGVAAILGLSTGCSLAPTAPINDAPAIVPERPASLPLGSEIALRAIALVGKPYRYGGADLDGFDCSGMVYFIHHALGLEVPRTAAEQQRAAQGVARASLQPGDLLFFRTTASQRISHVGVYVGDNRFVHAPQSGRLIELRMLDDAYYSQRLAAMGRMYAGS